MAVFIKYGKTTFDKLTLTIFVVAGSRASKHSRGKLVGMLGFVNDRLDITLEDWSKLGRRAAQGRTSQEEMLSGADIVWV